MDANKSLVALVWWWWENGNRSKRNFKKTTKIRTKTSVTAKITKTTVTVTSTKTRLQENNGRRKNTNKNIWHIHTIRGHTCSGVNNNNNDKGEYLFFKPSEQRHYTKKFSKKREIVFSYLLK